ncbi:class I SAM-dependent methyltransferase [Sphingobacterium multivorum]|uniref:class I SAM-dependent methyltransferase n=1 Tax=Sphingobacterium multivorum TaxID=28454 RepID=UPI0028A9AFDF|nr:class I SAM-dependent methyltransferase [Sphingobacterium multivorum]
MNKVELFENERASGYDQFVESWIPNYHYFLDQLPKLLRETENKDLLVVGCGTGNEIERFVDTAESWTITGVDPSPEMISQALEKFEADENVHLVEGVVGDLDEEKQFGAATLLLVLHFLEDNGEKLVMLQDISKRMMSQAPLLLLDITGNKEQIQQNLQLLRLLLPKGIYETQVAQRLRRIEHELLHVSEERLVELCEEAGFEPPVRFFQSSIYMGWITRKKDIISFS